MDDTKLQSHSHQDMQGLLNIVSEFFEIFEVKLNTSKSKYTSNDPTAPKDLFFNTTLGDNQGTVPQKLEYIPPNRATRYLGIYFALDGNWT